MIGALYAVLTIFLYPISYGPIQIRVSEALTILPFFTASAVPGLWAGCFAANFLSNAGAYDVVFGSLLTAAAAQLTYFCGKSKLLYLAPLPPVVLNSLGVSAYLQYFYDPPRIAFLGGLPSYWLFVFSIAAGEIAACYVIGLPLLLLLRKSRLVTLLRD